MYIDHVGINTNDMEATLQVLLRYTEHAVGPYHAYARWAPAL
jgi:hypothetical protein